ncbi:MAG: AAA family ATPase [Prevotellaceae bacterium]|nr:AAA family ATPase [Prevotellaceae bacterium]
MKQLTVQEKKAIQQKLQDYVSKYPSQNRAAQSLKGTSGGTVNSILQGKFENISDEMFGNILSQISSGGGIRLKDWVLCETKLYKEVFLTADFVRELNEVSWYVSAAGSGKTAAAMAYISQNKNAFLVSCSEDMTKRVFINEMAQCLGLKTDGVNTVTAKDMIAKALLTLENPVFIIDEADKLRDSIFLAMIDLYNKVQQRSGILFLSTSAVKRRLERGKRLEKCGFEEFVSRIGQKMELLSKNDDFEVEAICRANGISEKAEIEKVTEDARYYGFDLRRVRRAIKLLRYIKSKSK